MTTSRIVDSYEVALNGIRYRTTGGVTQVLEDRWAPKYVIGDTTKDSHQRISIWAPTFQGGIGKNKIHPTDRSNRAWWSTCQLRYDHQIVPARLATTTAVSGVTGIFTIGAIGELADEIYAAFGTSVRKYNNTTDSWGSSLAALPANATDSLTFRLGGTVYLAFATTGGYTYTSDGVAWTDNAKDAKYLAFWDNRLWGIDNTGLLWYAFNLGEEQNDAQLPLPNSSVNNLYVARNAAGLHVLFCATTEGIFVHDAEPAEWLYTELELPRHPDNGKGATRWRTSTYISSGLGVYQYTQGANQGIATIVGPDMDDGLPSDYRGIIKQLIGTHNELIAIVDSSRRASTSGMRVSGGFRSHTPIVMASDVGYSSVMGWNEAGWETKWLSAATARSITSAFVSNAYSNYRLWFALGQQILYIPLPREILNPAEDTTLRYASSAELITPWLEPDRDIDSTGIYLRVDVTDASANETVVADYGLNYATSWTNLGTINSNGVTEYLFPNSTAPTGTSFRTIRFRFTLARGSTTTNKPVIRSITFAYRKKLPPKYRFTMNIDLNKSYKEQSPKQMRAALRTAMESTTLVLFSYRNDSGADFGAADRRFYVDVESASNLEMTGEDERGVSQVTLVEV